MRPIRYSLGVLFAAALIVGCNDKTEEKPATPSSSPSAAAPAAPEATPSVAAPAAETTGAAPATQPAASAELSTQEAQVQLNQVMEYIKDHKYDLADKTLTQLEAHKAQLPTALQSQIGNARTMLNSARGGTLPNIQIPGTGSK